MELKSITQTILKIKHSQYKEYWKSYVLRNQVSLGTDVCAMKTLQLTHTTISNLSHDVRRLYTESSHVRVCAFTFRTQAAVEPHSSTLGSVAVDTL